MFRITPPSVVHAPVHPEFYTSGQTEGDTRTSSEVTITIEHPNMQVVPSDIVTVRTNSNFIDVPEIQFVTNFTSATMIAALLCRSDNVDLTGQYVIIEDNSLHTFCDNMPWLSCYDVRKGNLLLQPGTPVSLRYFTIWWYPHDLTQNCTIISAPQNCLRLRNGLLQLQINGLWFEASATTLCVEWNFIAYNDSHIHVNGTSFSVVPITSPPFYNGEPQQLFIGTPNLIDLMPALHGASVNVNTDMDCVLRVISTVQLSEVRLSSAMGTTTFFKIGVSGSEQFFESSDIVINQVSQIQTVPDVNPYQIQIVFNPTGFLRCFIMYTEKMTNSHLHSAYNDKDRITSFEHRSVNIQATSTELNSVIMDTCTQNATTLKQTSWLRQETKSSFFITPPSLVLLGTSQNTPYGLNQSITLEFNRRIEVFPKNVDTLFVIDSVHGVQNIRAEVCVLLSYQITIPNYALSLQPNTTYTVSLQEGKLFHSAGQVPCLSGQTTFVTVSD